MDPTGAAPAPSPATQRRGPPVALDALELWVGELERTRALLAAAFGFAAAPSPVSANPHERTSRLVCGDVTLVLREGRTPESAVARHVAAHGDTVADVALAGDPATIAGRALALGLDVSGAPDSPRIDMTGDGTICHTVRERPRAAAAARAAGTAAAEVPPMRGIDHVACCVRHGTLEAVARAYEEVFALERLDVGAAVQVGGAASGMRSAVLGAPPGFTVVLTEPAAAYTSGQTQRFLDAHAGPGVQHAAIAYDDLPSAVEALRDRGVAFLAAPEDYYERSQERLADRPLAWQELRRLEILVDADADGLLFQLFTRPLADRGTFFFELIERAGASGFGANNVRALFAALDASIREAT